MNKQELIEKYEYMSHACFRRVDTLEVLKDLRQLDEPEKVKVPQFVADWIKYCKNTNVTMTRALLVGEVDFYNYANQKDLSRLTDFFSDGKNQEIFARSWLDGYTVEKEKRYIIKFKNIQKGTEYLKFDRVIERWYFGLEEYSIERSIYHTRKEIEEAGFGWVFDCPGVKVKEATE